MHVWYEVELWPNMKPICYSPIHSKGAAAIARVRNNIYWATFPGMPISPVVALYPVHSKNLVTCLCTLVSYTFASWISKLGMAHMESHIFSLVSHTLHMQEAGPKIMQRNFYLRSACCVYSGMVKKPFIHCMEPRKAWEQVWRNAR